MMSKLENPPLMVVAGLRFHHPFGILFFFGGRWRRFVRALKQAPGLLLFQQLAQRPGRSLLPTTFLALTWWDSRESLKAWYNHAEHQRILEWSKGPQRRFDLWIEEYILREPGQYLGVAGGLEAAIGEKGIELRKASG